MRGRGGRGVEETVAGSGVCGGPQGFAINREKARGTVVEGLKKKATVRCFWNST